MTGRRGETHRRETPGADIERAVEDFGQLVATVIAAGPAEARRVVEVVPSSTLRAMVLTEATTIARVLLTEAKGDKLKAYDRLQVERRRWQ
jgi:hypothetical protein